MIQKVIHYCWFGGKPIDKLGEKCIASWKKYCPDYEIKRWDESNYNLEACDYVKEAYQAKKWAFVSDYVRFDILYHYGGLYPGLGLAANPGLGLYKDILDYYNRQHFISSDGSINLETVVQRVTNILIDQGFQGNGNIELINDVYIYPSEYFGPIDPVTKQKHITSNTRSIHHYSASWCDDGSKRRGQIYKMLYRLFGARGANTVKNIWHTFSKNRQ